jgi:hypothetical protein
MTYQLKPPWGAVMSKLSVPLPMLYALIVAVFIGGALIYFYPVVLYHWRQRKRRAASRRRS